MSNTVHPINIIEGFIYKQEDETFYCHVKDSDDGHTIFDVREMSNPNKLISGISKYITENSYIYFIKIDKKPLKNYVAGKYSGEVLNNFKKSNEEFLKNILFARDTVYEMEFEKEKIVNN